MYNNITVDFGKKVGKMKPVHAVNNGPVSGNVRGMNNDKYFTEAGIPYARLHDSAFCADYGGEYSVDVHRIFRDFDADENDPNAYVFEPTDNYLAAIDNAGTKIFYRLGAAIEHNYKDGTYPPKDFLKWAKICEHIIMHYTDGWANGFYYDIEYWEIWNEPDCTNADGSHPCWQGTKEQFIEFFVTVLGYLKKRFPHRKFGGPAFCGLWDDEYAAKLLAAIKDAGLTLDFYSFHCYTTDPHCFAAEAEHARRQLADAGLRNVELNLNEWNYMRGWLGDDHKSSLKTIISAKGAAFIAASMSVAQHSALDMFMYYDAQPSCHYNGLFDAFFDPLKGYYSFKMFNELYKAGSETEAETDDRTLYALSAAGNGKQLVLLTYFDDNDEAACREICLSLKGVTEVSDAKFYLLDKDNDMRLMQETLLSPGESKLYLKLQNLNVLLVEITPRKP